MTIMNYTNGRAWIGGELGRGAPVSERTWAVFLEQGMPHGTVGDSPIICTIAVGEWLRRRAMGEPPGGVGSDTPPRTDPPAPRKRGRPRKHRPNP
jgi:hypothetical protein